MKAKELTPEVGYFLVEESVGNDELQSSSAIASSITTVHIDESNSDDSSSRLLVQLMVESMQRKGLVSSEIVPPTDVYCKDWTLVQRFHSVQDMHDWKCEQGRVELVARLTESSGNRVSELEVFGGDPKGSVATAVVTRIKAGYEAAYADWEARIQSTQAKFPGYRGSYMQPPTSGSNGICMTLLRFDTPESLDFWFASDERRELMEEVRTLVDSKVFHGTRTSFPGWTPLDPNTGEPPESWKTTMLVLMVLYPIVLLQVKYLGPFLATFHSSVDCFLSLVICLVITDCLAMPIAVKAFDWWMFPGAKRTLSTQMKGISLIALIYVIQILTSMFVL